MTSSSHIVVYAAIGPKGWGAGAASAQGEFLSDEVSRSLVRRKIPQGDRAKRMLRAARTRDIGDRIQNEPPSSHRRAASLRRRAITQHAAVCQCDVRLDVSFVSVQPTGLV